jgi:beta-1,4-mannosyl-glycoprotein beta-1,4-N-acetylglucosaminyltransferase
MKDILPPESLPGRLPEPRIPFLLLLFCLLIVFLFWLFVLGQSRSKIPYHFCNLGMNRNRVFDCFMYNGESLVLLIRLRTLSPVVTTFILCYSEITHSGRRSIGLTYAPYENEISVFSKQLFPLVFDGRSAGSGAWDREKAQRHYLINGVKQQNPQPNDLVLISDVDEIPHPSAVRLVIAIPPKTFVTMRAHCYFYSMRYESDVFWVRNTIIRYGAIDRELGRYRGLKSNLLPGFTAEHCSYCFGTIREVARKLQGFGHVEFSSGQFVGPHHILARVLCGRPIFDGHSPYVLRELGEHELNLPPQAHFYGWRCLSPIWTK